MNPRRLVAGNTVFFPAATLLIAAAALARVLASLGVYDPLALLQLAALCWSGAFALLLIRLVRVRAYRN